MKRIALLFVAVTFVVFATAAFTTAQAASDAAKQLGDIDKTIRAGDTAKPGSYGHPGEPAKDPTYKTGETGKRDNVPPPAVSDSKRK